MTEINLLNIPRSTNADIEVCRATAPLTPESAWEVESLLLKIFEYGDYSFRSALLGEYSKTLNCSFFLAKHKGNIVGAAGCLYAHKNPAIAIVGPVGVAENCRGNGIGTRLVESLIDYLKTHGCMAAYLGVSPGTSATSFYKAIGFTKYQGIVMRFLMCSEKRFEKDYFGRCPDTKIRKVAWGDFPGVQGLITYPCSMYTSDFRRSIFSSKYVEPTRFLSVFPEMMRAFVRHGGFANVLVAGHKENVVGVAHVNTLAGKARRHMAELDFYIHDNFIEQAELLVGATIKESSSLAVDRVNCYCLDCDKIKRSIIEVLGGVKVATLAENAVLGDKYQDILVYQLKQDV